MQRQQGWFGLLAEPSKSFDDIDFANASGRAPPALKKRFAANWYCHPTSYGVGQRSLLDKFPVRDDRRRITSLGRRQMPPRKLRAFHGQGMIHTSRSRAHDQVFDVILCRLVTRTALADHLHRF